MDLYKDKSLLSEHLYSLIRSLCLNNSLSSEYLSKFIPLFTKHLGYGVFVSDTLEQIILSNENILEKISNLVISPGNTNLSISKLTKKTFIDEIFLKLKQFASFEKAELLFFLASLCHYKETAIYNNQEKVFKNLFYSFTASSEKEYMFTLFFEEKTDILYAQYRHNDRKLVFKISEIRSKEPGLSPEMIVYMKNQLRLYARLALGRNYTSFKYLKRIFPYSILIDMIFDEKIERELRAIFCQLATSLYIDAHPRTFLMKPNYIRIVKSKDRQKKKKKKNETNQGKQYFIFLIIKFRLFFKKVI